MTTTIPNNSDSILTPIAEGNAAAERTLAILTSLIKTGAIVQKDLDLAEQVNDQITILNSIVQALPQMIFVKNAVDGRYMLWNKAAERLTGRQAEEVVGLTDFDLVPPYLAQTQVEADKAVLAGGRVVETQVEPLFSAAGEVRQMYTIKSPILGKDGDPSYLLVISQDITERIESEELDACRLTVLEGITRGETLPETVLHMDDILSRRRPGWSLLAVLRSELDPSQTVVLSGNLPQAESGIAASLPRECWHSPAGDSSHDPNYSNITQRWPGVWSAPVLSTDSGTVGRLLTISNRRFEPADKDIAVLQVLASMLAIAVDRQALTSRLTYKSTHDTLTGLPNRALFEDRLARAARDAVVTGLSMAVVYFDLDGFRLINDTLGHEFGDQLLQSMAARLAEKLPSGVKLSRLGGDEFALLLTRQEDVKEAENIASNLLSQTRKPLYIQGQEIAITASIGLCAFPDDGRDASKVQRNADTAMHHAKRIGGDRFMRFHQSMAAAVAERLELRTRLRRAIEGGDLQLNYQPKVDRDRVLTGFEALLRWTDTQLGHVPPARFIPVAEDTGLILPLGSWVLNEACRRIKSWENALPPDQVPSLAVNVSALQFQQPGFLEQLQEVLDRSAIDPRHLELEITESLLLDHTNVISQKLAAVRLMGISVAIDDFGTGYSSLAYLQKLPISTLKIDRGFVAEIGLEESQVDPVPETDILTAANQFTRRKSNRGAVVGAICSMAHSLGMSIVAEGIENERQFRFLRKLGVQTFQGWMFSKAVTAEAALELAGDPERFVREHLANAELAALSTSKSA